MNRVPEALIRAAYAAFNARDIDGAVAVMTPDVVWPNGMEGGVVLGHDGVRAYWTRQWGMIDPHVEPQAIARQDDGSYAVTVHTVVKTLAGDVITDRMVTHVYSLRDGLVATMDIRD